MKRLLLMFIFVVCSIFIVGCDNKTEVNSVFFTTGKTDLHRDELKKVYSNYAIENVQDIYKSDEYEIYNLIDGENSEKYNLDIFLVSSYEYDCYYVIHQDDIYSLGQYKIKEYRSNGISNIAISDINNDGEIEIFISIILLQDENFCSCTTHIIDTFSKKMIQLVDYEGVVFFKKRNNKILLYDTNGIKPIKSDIVNGKLDEKFYNLATNLFEKPKLNKKEYKFANNFIKEKCDLFEIEVIIEENTINFPYIFKNVQSVGFSTIVKIKFLNEELNSIANDESLISLFIYFEDDKKIISMDNDQNTLNGVMYYIYPGKEITDLYYYFNGVNGKNKLGTYDLKIKCLIIDTNQEEIICLEDILLIS